MFQGEILEVMESWPLQLLLRSGERSRSLSLTDSTVIRRAGKTVSSGALSPGQMVAVKTSGDQAPVIIEIEILTP